MKRIIFYLLLLLLIISCHGIKSEVLRDYIKDVDGNIYNIVKIGKQWWMAENLKVTHYRNGDNLPNNSDDDEWDKPLGAWCSYNNDNNNIDIFGRLYNWFAVNDSRGLAPEGWHIPTDEEWETLVSYLGGSEIAGDKMKVLKAFTDDVHMEINSDEKLVSKSGFSALPGGYRYNHGVFDGIGSNPYFWSSTECSNGTAWYRYLYDGNSKVYRDNSGWKQAGYSIRCVKDN